MVLGTGAAGGTGSFLIRNARADDESFFVCQIIIDGIVIRASFARQFLSGKKRLSIPIVPMGLEKYFRRGNDLLLKVTCPPPPPTLPQSSLSSVAVTVKRLVEPGRPALPSNTNGPALFLGVRGPSPVIPCTASGESVLVISGRSSFVVSSASNRCGMSRPFTELTSMEALFDACRRAKSPLPDIDDRRVCCSFDNSWFSVVALFVTDSASALSWPGSPV